MPMITTKRGLKWHYELVGQGETLLFIHGFGVSSGIWVNQVKDFSSHYQVMTLDLPGHGGSSWMDVNLNDMAVDIKEILNTLDMHQVNIIGSSLGGLITFKLFNICPEKLHRAVFVGALPKFAREDYYPAGLDIPKIRKMSDQFQGDYKAILDIFFRSLFSRQERESPQFQLIKNFQKSSPAPQRAALLKFLEILEKDDLRHVLARMPYRVRFINGSEDYICPGGMVPWLEEHIPHARIDTIQGAGHFPFLTRPEEFNDLLQGFLMS